MRHLGSRAFSLIELLAVMGIIVIILAFVAPAAIGIVRGNKMTQASQIVSGQLSLARQTAITKNVPVEVRFYQFADPETPGETVSDPSTWRFRAVQAFEVVKARILTPLQEIRYLPGGVVLDSGSTLSSLLSSPVPEDGRDPIARAGTSYKFSSVRFRPDGSVTGVSLGVPSFMTLHNLSDGDRLSSAPNNYVAIEIDPINGTLKEFRPGL